MKKPRFSFLFFIPIVCMLTYILPSSHCSAQQATDSTTYFYYKIISPDSSGDLVEGYAYFKKYQEQRRLKRDTIAVVYALRMQAIAEFDLGQIYATEQSATEALQLIENASDALQFPAGTEIGVSNLLGMVYRTTAQPEKAIQTYVTALKNTSKLADSLKLLNNMANAHRDNGNYDEAISILTLVSERNKQLENPLPTARALDNLGYTQAKAGKPNGLPNMLEALALRKEINDPGQLFTSYNHLSEYYKNTGDLESAKAYAGLGKEIAKKVSVGYQKEALATYLSLSENDDIIEYMHITDSIREASLKQDNKFASVVYDFSKEKERTQAALLEREKERRKKSIFQLIVGSLLLLSIAFYFVVKYRHRKEKVEEVYRTESRISKKVHDEVANDLYQIMAKIQTASSTDETLLDDLDVVYHKTRDISKEHSLIAMDGDYGEIISDLLLPYQNSAVNVLTRNFSGVDWSGLTTEKKRALYRVLQELMTNMRKHSEATLVVVSAEQLQKKYAVTYVDNGKGGPIKIGNGLRNAENRIRSVKGTIIFDTTTNKGFTAKITL